MCAPATLRHLSAGWAKECRTGRERTIAPAHRPATPYSPPHANVGEPLTIVWASSLAGIGLNLAWVTAPDWLAAVLHL